MILKNSSLFLLFVGVKLQSTGIHGNELDNELSKGNQLARMLLLNLSNIVEKKIHLLLINKGIWRQPVSKERK